MVPFAWIVQHLFLICIMTFVLSGKLVVWIGNSNFVLLEIQGTTLPSSSFQFGQRGLLAKFAFILCHKVCICPMSQSLHLSHVTKLAFILYHKVCIHLVSQRFHSSYAIKFVVPFLLVHIGYIPLIYIQISATICFQIIYKS